LLFCFIFAIQASDSYHSILTLVNDILNSQIELADFAVGFSHLGHMCTLSFILNNMLVEKYL